ncbi:MAG: hypothetical protein AAFV29_17965, partial [Myxococcota bacterium]
MLTNIILTALVSTPAAPSALHARIERAVLHGDASSLQQVRKDLDREAATTERAGTRYLKAYLNWRIGQTMWAASGVKVERERLLKEARKQLEAHLKKHAQDGEAQALLATILGELIAGDSERAPKLGRQSVELMAQAATNTPESPRVALMRGIWFLFMPAMYGGGLDR